MYGQNYPFKIIPILLFKVWFCVYYTALKYVHLVSPLVLFKH
jgi:hypothetical protein